ncbi:hypothetical protein I546_3013 [Mycobacterium kansasii 732]|nr:hypothetical protein I546_3013 [Mycobacterium kansasii 732]
MSASGTPPMHSRPSSSELAVVGQIAGRTAAGRVADRWQQVEQCHGSTMCRGGAGTGVLTFS